MLFNKFFPIFYLHRLRPHFLVISEFRESFPDIFYIIVTSLQIREKRLAWMSEGDFPHIQEFFFLFRISSLLHDELQDDRVYLRCWVE